MPRINPVPESERAIGRRLRDAREARMAKRTRAALKVGISPDQLASYELGRVPLPWASGYRLCELLNIGQDWLATGEGERDLFVSLGLSQQDANELGSFSSVFSGKHAGDLSAIRGGALASADTAIELLKNLSLVMKRIKTDSKLREKVRGDPRWMALLKETEETCLAVAKAMDGEKKKRKKIEAKLR